MNARHTRSATVAWAARWALLAALCFGGHAMAQTEPTLDQVYQEAQAGHVEHALQLMQPVLRAHPSSAKAHYVEAELLARQGQAGKARDELSAADRLSPGLPFASADAVRNLRRELMPAAALTRSNFAPATAYTAPQPTSHNSIPWGVLWAVCGGAFLAWVLMRLGRPAAGTNSARATGYAGPAAVPAWPAAGASPAYAGAGPAPGPLSAPSMGGQLAGGLATGLAVGAGVMAAEAIGKTLFGGDRHSASGFGSQPASFDETRLAPIREETNLDPDMGGRDFGIQNAGSWDDDVVPDVGGNDWDN